MLLAILHKDSDIVSESAPGKCDVQLPVVEDTLRLIDTHPLESLTLRFIDSHAEHES